MEENILEALAFCERRVARLAQAPKVSSCPAARSDRKWHVRQEHL